jgi:transcriptional regulator with XRE-family HTH domain
MTPKGIRELRKRLGWSLAEFGQHFGVSPQAVLKWERGKARPSDFALATMIQLNRRLDALSDKQKNEFINGLKTALLTGGILALLAYLFQKE